MNGFSLIELVIVVAVLAVLAAIAVPAFQNMAESGREAAAKSTLATIYKECEVSKMQSATSVGAHSDLVNGGGVTYTGQASPGTTTCSGVASANTGSTTFTLDLSNGTKGVSAGSGTW